ncbi:hypothetical protein N9E35_03225 [Candidatus Marinimicrobia bacterium]|nr:hypothetical protein [Candidatus Neomarinimicrobiota bacterium]
MRWNTFRKAHAGKKQSEISELWAKYKAGEYEVPRNIEGEDGKETVEMPRKKAEKKTLSKSKKTKESSLKKLTKRGFL